MQKMRELPFGPFRSTIRKYILMITEELCVQEEKMIFTMNSDMRIPEK